MDVRQALQTGQNSQFGAYGRQDGLCSEHAHDIPVTRVTTRYIHPLAMAMRTASNRLWAPVFAIAEDR